jgi:hypothetical protein
MYRIGTAYYEIDDRLVLHKAAKSKYDKTATRKSKSGKDMVFNDQSKRWVLADKQPGGGKKKQSKGSVGGLPIIEADSTSRTKSRSKKGQSWTPASSKPETKGKNTLSAQPQGKSQPKPKTEKPQSPAKNQEFSSESFVANVPKPSVQFNLGAVNKRDAGSYSYLGTVNGEARFVSDGNKYLTTTKSELKKLKEEGLVSFDDLTEPELAHSMSISASAPNMLVPEKYKGRYAYTGRNGDQFQFVGLDHNGSQLLDKSDVDEWIAKGWIEFPEDKSMKKTSERVYLRPKSR